MQRSLKLLFARLSGDCTCLWSAVELSTSRSRSLICRNAHGIASGLAKLGGFVGVLLFPLLENFGGLALALGVAACTAALGFALTGLLLPEPNQRSLEEM